MNLCQLTGSQPAKSTPIMHVPYVVSADVVAMVRHGIKSHVWPCIIVLDTCDKCSLGGIHVYRCTYLEGVCSKWHQLSVMHG